MESEAPRNAPSRKNGLATERDEPRCAYCAQPDGKWGRTLVLEPAGYLGPMHDACMADIARYGAD